MDAVIGVAVEYTIRPILHQIGYIFCYKGNIKEVENKLEALETTKDSVQILVSQDKGKGNAIFDGVTKWLDCVKEVLDVTQQKEAPNPSCFNFVKRHQLSRRAKKRGDSLTKINVGYPVPSPHTNSPTLPTHYQIIESRTLVVREIKDALANPNVNKVGVCGMGGVGKTALLNEVKKLVLENNLFDRVIHVEVGQSKSVVNIQEEIRGKLNMELNMQSEDVRASCLKTHIVERKENILFMLDDLWKPYDLEKKFGIRCHSGCKILITSRSQHTLKNQTNTEELFEVNSLTEEESWKFFVATVGEFVEDVGYVQQIAKDVVKECGGLPIALKIVAIAVKGKKSRDMEGMV
ncbi:unnamed protein product [Citrullus colocynthis]|uniref:NB-ARC domain-containing protein n=1 Tax=Citrullus colocynthis TaxID=252529 RepID=A0ABP0YXH5_9ROSI